MSDNFEKIRYIFQIPLSWFRKIERLVTGAYGVNFIKVDVDTDDGGLQIGVDDDAFRDRVLQIASQIPEGAGTVKSVDGIGPDKNGNVGLGALQADDITSPGEIVGPRYAGSKSVCGSNHDHNVMELEGMTRDNGDPAFVMGVRLGEEAEPILPDRQGIVNLGHTMGTVTSVNDIAPDDLGNVDLGPLVYTVNQIQPDENGNVQIDGGGTVKTVNQTQPDEEGNVDLGQLVYTVNGVGPDGLGNVDIGESVQQAAQDAAKNVVTTQVPAMINSAIQAQAAPKKHSHAHTDISDWNDATKTFLDATDITHVGDTVGLDYNGDYSVCGPNHGHKLKDITDFDQEIGDRLEGDFVTRKTVQSITAAKTFKDFVYVTNNTDLATRGVTLDPSGRIYVEGDNGSGFLTISRNGTASASLGFAEDVFVIRHADGMLIGPDSKTADLMLDAGADHALLVNEPSDTTQQDHAIATVGWVRRNAIAPDSTKKGYVYMDGGQLSYKDSAVSNVKTVVTGISWNGTQIVATRENWTLTNGLVTKTASATPQTINTTTYTGN